MTIEDHTKELAAITVKKAKIETPEGSEKTVEDTLIHEHFLEVSVNGYAAFRLSCTAEHLQELVIGRLYTEGLIASVNDIGRLFFCGKGNIAEVTLAENITFQPYQGTEPTCCAGNRQLLAGRDQALQPLPSAVVDREAVFALAGYFQRDSKLHRSTSGTHSCYLYLPGSEITSFEDISRHNALDKAVGHMLHAGADPAGCMLYTTGRVPVDMVQKTVMSRVPVLVSKSVPTDEAVTLAAEYHLHLLCKAWPDSFTVYA